MARQTNRNRTALFGDQPQRVHSPYDPPSQRDYTASELASMESQSEEDVNGMRAKVAQLKKLSTTMGNEIRNSNKTLDAMADSMGNVGDKLKRTWTQMLVVAQRSGVPLKWWAALFATLGLFFFYIWIR